MAIDEEFMDDWLIRTVELIEHLKPRILYFDWWIQEKALKGHLKKLAAYYYNRAEEWGGGVICYKHDAFMFGSAVPDVERGVYSEAKPWIWQTDTAVARNSWCYTENNSYKSVNELCQYLSDVVSKNGNLLLNIGPKADGTIPEEDTALLKGLGAWLKVNGEAIYASKPWRVVSEGPTVLREGQFTDGSATPYTEQDFRFTVKGDSIYAIALKASEDGSYRIRSLGKGADTAKTVFMGMIEEITALGYDGPLSWEQKGDALEIQAPGLKSALPVVFRVKTW